MVDADFKREMAIKKFKFTAIENGPSTMASREFGAFQGSKVSNV